MTFAPTSGTAVIKGVSTISRTSASLAFTSSCQAIACSSPRLALARDLEKTAISGSGGLLAVRAASAGCGARLSSPSVW